jgi:hypothetical protein
MIQHLKASRPDLVPCPDYEINYKTVYNYRPRRDAEEERGRILYMYKPKDDEEVSNIEREIFILKTELLRLEGKIII